MSQHPRTVVHVHVDVDTTNTRVHEGWLPARKETQNVPTSGRATATAAILASVHNNWLGLQQTAAAACCCIAVTRAPLRTNGVPPRKKERNFIPGNKVPLRTAICTHRWGLNLKTNRSLHLRPQLYITLLSSIISRVKDFDDDTCYNESSLLYYTFHRS